MPLGLIHELISLMKYVSDDKRKSGEDKLDYVVEKMKERYSGINTLDIIEMVDALIDVEKGKIRINKRELRFCCFGR